jgi:hypothetical protein
MWGHNSDGPSEERKIHQLRWLVHYLFSTLHTYKISTSSGGECYMQVMAVEVRGIRNAYEMLTRKSQVNTGHTQKNGAVSKVNKKFMSHISRAQPTPSAAATVQVSLKTAFMYHHCPCPSMKFVIG